jgi:hypothetical protein
MNNSSVTVVPLSAGAHTTKYYFRIQVPDPKYPRSGKIEIRPLIDFTFHLAAGLAISKV